MADETGTPTDHLDPLGELRNRPYSFSIFHAIRLLDARHSDSPRTGESLRPSDESYRIGQQPTMAFSPSTLREFGKSLSGNKPRLVQTFLGLFGPEGPLPLHLTEYARDRCHNEKDFALARFADIFHHRMVSLYYRAWAAGQPTVQFDRPDQDRFAEYVGSLIGIGMDSFRERDAMPDLAKLHFAGKLASQSMCTDGLHDILRSFFHLPIRILEFVGQWIQLPVESHCRIGQTPAAATLGSSLTIGRKVWDCQQKFRIEIGPMDLADYERLLPGGDSLERVIAIVKNYVGFELQWDVRLILKKEEAPGICLGRQGRLGWTDWLMNRAPKADCSDLILAPCE